MAKFYDPVEEIRKKYDRLDIDISERSAYVCERFVPEDEGSEESEKFEDVEKVRLSGLEWGMSAPKSFLFKK